MGAPENYHESVAIIGLAGRFPGAGNIQEFWNNVVEGKNSISEFEEARSGYVGAKGVLADADKFDETFFQFSPKEAAYMDPQHRVFLELAYKALEQSGYINAEDLLTGVFASCSFNTYLINNLLKNQRFLAEIDQYKLTIGNAPDFLATKVAYKLNLKGIAETVQTGCSSSLVAIRNACVSLLHYQCDLAVAGGISITSPLEEGYPYKKEGILSPDAHCRPFDQKANGTVPGNGGGVVILKRLSEALEDNDTIYATIKGIGINNDGARKVSYTAPSQEGQKAAILMALDEADISPNSVGLVECHGTGTKIGDPIEFNALKAALNTDNTNLNYCALSSSKSNIGHLDAASGVVGLIKAALCVYYKKIPPLANFEHANNELNIDVSPFYINKSLINWEAESGKRVAGVSSFGIGGTNVHLLLQEVVLSEERIFDNKKEFYFIPISSNSQYSLNALVDDVRNFITNMDQSDYASLSYTFCKARKRYSFRECLIIENSAENAKILKVDDSSMKEFLSTFDVTDDYNKWVSENIGEWLAGRSVNIDRFKEFFQGPLKVIPAPTYVFEKNSHWVYPDKDVSLGKANKKAKVLESSDEIMSTLANHISTLVGQDDIDVDVTFNHLGLDSLHFLDWIEKIENDLSVEVTLDDFVEYSSLSVLSDYLKTCVKKNSEKTTSFLHLLRKSKEPKYIIICIHPAGGVTTVFRDLVSKVSDNATIYGIRAQGLIADEQKNVNNSIEEMARLYVGEIEKLDIQKPFCIVGSSIGGLIGLEIEKLLKPSCKPEFIAMLDTPFPSHLKNSEIPDTNEKILGYIKENSEEMYSMLQQYTQQHRQGIERVLSLWKNHAESLLKYSPLSTKTKVLYFEASSHKDISSSKGKHLQSWDKLLPRLYSYSIPGNHLSIHTNPNVQQIADTLNCEIK